MAAEIQLGTDTSGLTLYAHIWNAVGLIWNGAAFEAYLTANIATYNIALVEKGTASRYYVGTFPAASSGTYQLTVQQRVGGSVAESDPFMGIGEYEWDGSALVPLSSRLPTSSYTAPDNADIVLIKAKTDNLPTDPADASAVAALIAAIPASVWAEVLETGFSASRELRIAASAVAGKSVGSVFRNLADTLDQISGTATADGDRTAASYGA